MRRLKWLLFFIFLLMLVGVYVLWIEPSSLKTTVLDFGQAVSDNSIKIVYFADLHLSRWGAFQEKLLKTIAGQHPDCIFFGGDALAKKTNVSDLERFFFELAKIAPVYAIFGNWEDEAPIHMIQRYRNLGITLIDKDTQTIFVRGMTIGITGIQSHYFIRQVKHMELLDETDWQILLIHAPNRLEQYPEFYTRFDLVLAGHTHGGQFYIPYLTQAALKISGNDSLWLRGQYRAQQTTVYVTNGVGQWFPGRLFSTPEIVSFSLPKVTRDD
ncbi:MAG TPA: metallophosphoesterase [Thermotogota bacterium]|mgnify:FL=1|nr:metallophosphoesterase [Thermotogota bacterium]